MAKPLRILFKLIAIAIGIIAVLLVSLDLVLDSGFLQRKVTDIAGDMMDAELNVSDIDVSLLGHFPKVRVTIDTVTLTYPHDKYSDYDTPAPLHAFMEAGRGVAADTLARLDRLQAAVNLWQLAGKRFRLADARISGLSLYAHKYDSTAANWNIFSFEKEDKQDDPSDLPWISVGSFLIDGTPTVYYTDRTDTLAARLSFDSFSLKGAAKLGFESGTFSLKGLSMSLDSLLLDYFTPSNDINASVDALTLQNPARDNYSLKLDAAALARLGELGTFDVPVHLDGSLYCDNKRGEMLLETENFGGEVAYIPLMINGLADFTHDGTKIDLNLNVDDCDLAGILDRYVRQLVPAVSDFLTDVRLDMDVKAKGMLGGSRIPAIEASIHIPSSNLAYLPMNLCTDCELELDASLSERKVLDAVIHSLKVNGDGLDLNLKGDVSNLFGQWKLNAGVDASAALGTVSRFLPDSLGIDASGNLQLNATASVTKNELKTLKFNDSSLDGVLSSDCIGFAMPGDTLAASAYSPQIRLGVSKGNIVASVNADSIYFERAGLSANVRAMCNSLRCYPVESRGKTVPHIEFNTNGKTVALRTEESRMALRNVDVRTSFQQKARRRASADSSLVGKIREWSPKGSISVDGGAAVIPAVPLRTRLTGLRGNFDERFINLDTLAVRIGSTDLGLDGQVRGFLRALAGRGVLSADMNVKSGRLDLDEILVAFGKGSRKETEILDSIPDADATKADISVIKVPGNVDFKLGLIADRVDFAEMGIKPLIVNIAIKDKVARLTDMSLQSEVGDMDIEAYYATKSMSDVSFGADLHLMNVSSKEIIYMLPNVDSLMPALRHFEGKLGADMSISSQLDSGMNVLWPTLEAILRIRGRDLMISDAGNLRKVTKLLMFKNKNIGHIDDLSVDAVVHNGELEVFPFKLGVDRYRCILAGVQDIDRKLNYHISITQSPFIIPFGVNIYGYTDNWKYSLGLARYRNANMPVYTEQLDAIQLNLVESIRNIYNVGVEKARGTARMGGYFMKKMSDYNDRKMVSELSGMENEESAVDSLAFELAMNDEDADLALETEVNAAIESCRDDFDRLIERYHAKNENKGILRKIEQMGKEREKK